MINMDGNKHPNGVWIWRLNKLRHDYLEKLVELKVKRVYLKVYDDKDELPFWEFQCTPAIIQQFKQRGIEVYGWGYHRGKSYVDICVKAVKQAFDCGLAGYVLDVEGEIKNPETHPYMEKLLASLRPLIPAGVLGYASYGAPHFHREFPWKMFDHYCDLAFPMIYFEKFSFKPTNEEEVQVCLQGYQQMGLTKPLLPVWSSEWDAKQPVSAKELQSYLNRFPGSSIWRLPQGGESGALGQIGEAWNLRYGNLAAIINGSENLSKLPLLTNPLLLGSQGDLVKALQTSLQERGFYSGVIDSLYGLVTEAAVKTLQAQAGITMDGVVGPDTWKMLGGEVQIKLDRPPENVGKHIKLADLAQREGGKQLSWGVGYNEAEKYLEPMREPMRQKGQIGSKPVFYNWCAAFVTWCCREVGINIPDTPEGFYATMALVDSWKYWAKKNRYWYNTGAITPRRGDIVVFEWFNGTVSLDHIGIVRGYTAGSSVIETSEGNASNKTANLVRDMKNIAGIIRIK